MARGYREKVGALCVTDKMDDAYHDYLEGWRRESDSSVLLIC